jgi:hypothetical protein
MLEKLEKGKIKKRFTELSPKELEKIVGEAIVASNKDQLEVMNSK